MELFTNKKNEVCKFHLKRIMPFLTSFIHAMETLKIKKTRNKMG
jgi:hypothetical protein